MNKLVWHEFSTDALPGRERFPVFCEELTRHPAALDAARPDMRFSGTIKRCLLGNVDVARIATTVASIVRMPELGSDGRDAVSAVICLQGRMLYTQGEAPAALGSGEGIICDVGESGELQMEGETHCWV